MEGITTSSSGTSDWSHYDGRSSLRIVVAGTKVIRNMKNVKLEKASRGWFLTIGDESVNNRWAVTSAELQELKEILNEKEIIKEIDHEWENEKVRRANMINL